MRTIHNIINDMAENDVRIANLEAMIKLQSNLLALANFASGTINVGDSEHSKEMRIPSILEDRDDVASLFYKDKK